jgi:hypothetical protein
MITTPVYRTTTAARSAPSTRTPQRWDSIDPSNTLAKTRNNVVLASTTKEYLMSLGDLLCADNILKQSHRGSSSSSTSRGCRTKFKIKRRNAMNLINHPAFVFDVSCSDSCDPCLDSTFLTSSKSSSSSGRVLLPTMNDCSGSIISLFDKILPNSSNNSDDHDDIYYSDMNEQRREFEETMRGRKIILHDRILKTKQEYSNLVSKVPSDSSLPFPREPSCPS